MAMIREREAMGLVPDVVARKLALEWPAPGWSLKNDEGRMDLIKPQEVFDVVSLADHEISMGEEKDPPSTPSEIRALVQSIFLHFKSDAVSTYDFNTLLARMGYRRGVKSARKFARKLKDENYIREIHNSFLRGSVGYAKGSAMK